MSAIASRFKREVCGLVAGAVLSVSAWAEPPMAPAKTETNASLAGQIEKDGQYLKLLSDAQKEPAQPAKLAEEGRACAVTHVEACESRCCPPLAPNMIGDSLGVPLSVFFPNPNFIPFHITKISSNNSPLPQDRVAFSYNLYGDVQTANVPGTGTIGKNIDEFTFIVEKMFLNDMVSIQSSLPVAQTIDNSQSPAAFFDEDLEMGDAAVTVKALLYRTDRLALSSGLLTELPTSDDFKFQGVQTVERNSWYLTPFAGLLLTPNDRWFAQGFVSHRNVTNKSILTPGLGGINFIKEQDLFMVDLGMGYWLMQNPGGRGLTGLASLLELHYTTTTTDVQPAAIASRVDINRADHLTLTSGLTAEINNNDTVTLALGLPLREANNRNFGGVAAFGQTDRTFDWELMLQLNHRFGGSAR